jgi:cyanate permease
LQHDFIHKSVIQYFTYISGLGGASGWTASMIAPNFHFKKYRNIAQGISFSGIGAGMFGVPPIISWTGNNYGSFGFFVALACVSAQFIVCGMIARPSSLEIHSRHVRKAETNKRGERGGILSMYLKILTTKSVVCYTLSMFAYGFGMYIIFVYLPVYCIRQGSSEMQASYILSICGLSSIFGRIVTGFIANFRQVNEISLYVGSLTIIAIISAMIPLYTASLTGQIAFAIVFGLFFGCPYITITPINFTFIGVGHISSALGIELCGCGAGGIVGPILAGEVFFMVFKNESA